MPHLVHDPRLVSVPKEHRDYAAQAIKKLGPRAAAKFLGIGRGAILSIIGLGECMPGTAALLREAFARKETE